MYQVFEIKLKQKEIDLRKLDKTNKRNWYYNGWNIVRSDGGLQYVLDLSNFTIKCLISELFPIREGKWSPEDYPAREEMIKAMMTELEKLPFDLEIEEIRRIVKRER